MSDERRRVSDIQDDELDGRRVDKWPVEPRGKSHRNVWLDDFAYISDKAIAARLNVSLPTVARWRNDTNAPRPAMIPCVVQALRELDPLDDLMAIRGCEGCP
jgi:hypothetical protein